MAIIPTVRCRNMQASLAFYSGILDFECVNREDDFSDPSFAVLTREGDRLLLSSHSGEALDVGLRLVVAEGGKP
jgi:catechol 2,3-dioxygenase-like lactoylglutathione lyase family enzyme